MLLSPVEINVFVLPAVRNMEKLTLWSNFSPALQHRLFVTIVDVE
jgi:hypothetical protein